MAKVERKSGGSGAPAPPVNGAEHFLPATASLPAARAAAARAELYVTNVVKHFRALFGSRFSVTRERGRILASRRAPLVLATLRTPPS